MDATFRPRHFSPELFSYAENKKIFEIFQNILDNLCVDRPTRPLEYVYDLLIKGSVYNVPHVYVLGPPSVDRTLVCLSLTLKLGLIQITRQGLMESNDTAEPLNLSSWTNLVKERTDMPDCARNGWLLEGFPQTRTEAFSLKRRGIFPTHIVLVEPVDLFEINIDNECSEEVKNYLKQKLLILDLHRNSYVKTFTFESDVEVPIRKVLDFVRSKKSPPMPYLPRVLLMGPYGSGRRTTAKKLNDFYHLIVVNFQEELRRAAMKDSPVKNRIHEILKTASPIPDDLLATIASERLLQKDCTESGWVMYNFPDTVEQAELLVKKIEGFQVNRAVFLDARLEVCLDRVQHKRIDPLTGEKYHLKLDHERIPNMAVRDRLLQLPQDSEESVEAEHKLYSDNVEGLKAFFGCKLLEDISVNVDANESEDRIFESVQGAILQSSKMKLVNDAME